MARDVQFNVRVSAAEKRIYEDAAKKSAKGKNAKVGVWARTVLNKECGIAGQAEVKADRQKQRQQKKVADPRKAAVAAKPKGVPSPAFDAKVEAVVRTATSIFKPLPKPIDESFRLTPQFKDKNKTRL